MKTKIIYISGNEIFSINDIRAAFEEVRNALNLDSDTVLFGVPVDNEDAGFGSPEAKPVTENIITEPVVEEEPESVTEEQVVEIVETPVEIIKPKPATKKRKSSTKKTEVIEPTAEEITEQISEDGEEKVVPILSVLSGDDADTDIEITEDVEPEIIADAEPITEETEIQEPVSLPDELPETKSESDADEKSDEAGLEQLLSAIAPLKEDFMEDKIEPEPEIPEVPEPENIDATLEQLATEFVASQDKIQEETKSNSRSKIGKLRNILPFKQSKNKDSQGLGDLFGWAGVAANDEDFSVPGFFTNVASKK